MHVSKLLYQDGDFRTNRKTKMADLPFDLLRHFWRLLLNSTKHDRKQAFKVFYKILVLGSIGISKIATGHLICWDIFDFSATTEWNSTKIDRRQVLTIIHHVCVFRTDHYQHVKEVIKCTITALWASCLQTETSSDTVGKHVYGVLKRSKIHFMRAKSILYKQNPSKLTLRRDLEQSLYMSLLKNLTCKI